MSSIPSSTERENEALIERFDRPQLLGKVTKASGLSPGLRGVFVGEPHVGALSGLDVLLQNS